MFRHYLRDETGQWRTKNVNCALEAPYGCAAGGLGPLNTRTSKLYKDSLRNSMLFWCHFISQKLWILSRKGANRETYFLCSVGFSSQFSGNFLSSLWMTARRSWRQRISSSSCSIRWASVVSLRCMEDEILPHKQINIKQLERVPSDYMNTHTTIILVQQLPAFDSTQGIWKRQQQKDLMNAWKFRGL